MKTKASWKDKYLISLEEDLTIKQIMKLRDCGEPKAKKIRDDSIEYCIANDIEYSLKKIPTIAVLEVTKKGIEYYFKKMELESRAV